MGRTLFWPLFQREHHVSRSPRCYRMSAHHGWVRFRAIDSLTSGKAPGNDGIPPDLIKHCKITLLLPLREVLRQCWQEGAVPQDTRNSTRDMLFAEDAAVATHTQEELQSLMDCFSQACENFGLTISLEKTNVLGQDTEAPPVITIDDYELEVVCYFTYLGSNITDNLSLEVEIDKRSGKAASTLARLTVLVRRSPTLSVKTNMALYMDYVYRAGEKAQHIPPEKHPPHPGNILAFTK